MLTPHFCVCLHSIADEPGPQDRWTKARAGYPEGMDGTSREGERDRVGGQHTPGFVVVALKKNTAHERLCPW